MKRVCPKCGSPVSLIKGPLLLSDSRLGMIAIEKAAYWQCSACKTKLYPLETARQIEEEKRKQRDELIRAHSIGEFLNASETAVVLKISRQALHKHHRISNGFIYQTKMSGKTVFLKKSVILFKQTGDGRFQLTPNPIPNVEFAPSFAQGTMALQSVFVSSSSTQAVDAYTGATKRGPERSPTTKVFTNDRR